MSQGANLEGVGGRGGVWGWWGRGGGLGVEGKGRGLGVGWEKKEAEGRGTAGRSQKRLPQVFTPSSPLPPATPPSPEVQSKCFCFFSADDLTF